MRSIAILLLIAGTATAQPTQPIEPGATAYDDAPLKREIEALRARQRDLERRLAVTQAATQAAQAAAQAAAAAQQRPQKESAAPVLHPAAEGGVPRFRFGRGGFIFSTADGKTDIRLRAVFNLDGHAYFGDTQPIGDTFFIRRARPFIDGTLFDTVDFRIMPDFAQGTATLLDAYVELRPWRWLRLRGGRFMVPVGLEWLQKDTTTAFVERSLATDLVPYRDIGLMLTGDLADGTFSYQLAVLNGAPDGGNAPDFDPQTSKDYVGRVFLRPLRRTSLSSWTDLGFGIAGSYGRVHGTAAASYLPTYHSVGQQTIFTYATASAGVPAAAGAATTAAGDRWRVTPQLYWYIGPLGLMAEYVMSSQRVQRMDAVADIENRAWNLTLSFVMTMERATYDGVVPKHPVDFRHKSFGAFELVLRYSELRFDAEAFPTFADPAVSVSGARELAGGINWYLTDYVKVMISFHRTDFSGGAPMGADREPENALMGRLQLAL